MSASILVAGFHRSGTSAVARALHTVGLHLGHELLGAESANPYGHFEDLAVIAAHDDALGRTGQTWKSPDTCADPNDEILRGDIQNIVTDRERSGRPWAIKDPRLCLFLQEWLDAAPAANVIVVFRRPGDAIASLHRRHVRRFVHTRGVDPTDRAFWERPDLGVKLWIRYHEQLLAQLPAPERVLALNFSDRASIEQLPNTVSQRWGIPVTTTEPIRLDPRLGTPSPDAIEVRDTTLIERARYVWGQLLAITPN